MKGEKRNGNSDAGNIRLQVDLSLGKAKEMEALMKEASIPTKKEFFNLALTMLKWVIKETEAGRIIASVDEKEKKYKEVIIPALTGISVKKKFREEQNNNDKDLTPVTVG